MKMDKNTGERKRRTRKEEGQRSDKTSSDGD